MRFSRTDRSGTRPRGERGQPPAVRGSRTTLGRWLTYQDRFDEARTTLDEQLAKATATGDELGRNGLLLRLTELECRAGDWRRADELATECYELFERRGLELQGAAALYPRALVDAHLGRVEECRAAALASVAFAGGRFAADCELVRLLLPDQHGRRVPGDQQRLDAGVHVPSAHFDELLAVLARLV